MQSINRRSVHTCLDKHSVQFRRSRSWSTARFD
jgi:hypothetical protein